MLSCKCYARFSKYLVFNALKVTFSNQFNMSPTLVTLNLLRTMLARCALISRRSIPGTSRKFYFYIICFITWHLFNIDVNQCDFKVKQQCNVEIISTLLFVKKIHLVEMCLSKLPCIRQIKISMLIWLWIAAEVLRLTNVRFGNVPVLLAEFWLCTLNNLNI